MKSTCPISALRSRSLGMLSLGRCRCPLALSDGGSRFQQRAHKACLPAFARLPLNFSWPAARKGNKSVRFQPKSKIPGPAITACHHSLVYRAWLLFSTTTRSTLEQLGAGFLRRKIFRVNREQRFAPLRLQHCEISEIRLEVGKEVSQNVTIREDDNGILVRPEVALVIRTATASSFLSRGIG